MSRGFFTYASREDVKNALDILENSRADFQIDRVLRSSSDSVETITRRRFYPEQVTIKLDWPSIDSKTGYSWRLWLDSNEFISIDSLSSGGTVINPSDYILRRSDDRNEPPYDHIELLLDSNSSFMSGNTYQQSIEIQGLAGFNDEQQDAGQLDGDINSSVNEITVSNGALIGVGNLLTIENERLVAFDRNFVDSSFDITSNITTSDSSVGVSDGTQFNRDEIILINSEKMLITTIAGNSLLVKRAWDGTSIASHSIGDSIFVSRSISVKRGVFGSTASNHLDTTAITVLEVPPLIRDLTIAETLVSLLQERTGMARTVGSGESEKEARGVGLIDIRHRVSNEYRRYRWG